MIKSICGSTRTMVYRTGAGFCFALSVMAGMAAAPATVPGTYGTLAVGDVHGLIDNVGELASKINPGFSGDMIKSQLGMFLGDPGLKNIPEGAGLILAISDSQKPFLLLETAEGKADAVVEIANQRGMGKAEAISAKLVAIAPDASALENAKGETGKAVAAALEGNDDKFLMLTVDADRLFKDKEADVKKGIDSIVAQAKKQSGGEEAKVDMAGKFLGNMLAAIAKRTDVAQVKIDISAKGVQFEKLAYPLGGVQAGKAEGPSGAELLKSIPVKGNPMALYQSTMDIQWAVKGLAAIVSESLEGTGVSAADKDNFVKLITDVGESYGDGMAGYNNIVDDAKMEGAYVISVTDEAKAIAYYDDSLDMTKGHSMASMYESLGVPTTTTLTKDAGKVGDKSYNAFKMVMDIPDGSGRKEQTMDGKYMVVGGNKMILSMGDVSIDELANAVTAGSADSAKTLKSAENLDPNAAIYIDYDAGAFGKIAAKDNEQVGKALEKLSGSPIQEALYINDDNLRFVIHVPVDLITKAIGSFTAMKQEAAPAEPKEAE